MELENIKLIRKATLFPLDPIFFMCLDNGLKCMQVNGNPIINNYEMHNNSSHFKLMTELRSK